VRERSARLVEIFGGVRAADGGTPVTIQSRTGHGNWTTLAGGATRLGPGGYFDKLFRVSASGRSFRFLSGNSASRTAGAKR
jgi:hypothetical protein